MRPLPLSAVLMVAACAESAPIGPTEAQVAIRKLVAAPSTIPPGGASVITFEVTAATRVLLATADGATLLDGAELAGALEVQPDATTDYLLTAEGPGGPRTLSVRVLVADAPVVDRFEAVPATVSLGGTSTLHWAVSGADIITLEDIDRHLILETTEPVGRTDLLVTTASRTLVLTAAGLRGTTEARTTILGLGGPIIDRFEVTPTVFLDDTTVTVSYETTQATSVSLVVDGAPAVGFDGSAVDGTHSFMTSETVELVFTATNQLGEVDASAQVAALPRESEPNNAPAAATTVPALGIVGEISPGDHDYYRVTVDEGGSVWAALVEGTSIGCGVPTTLRLLGPDGTTVLGETGPATCVEIEPVQHAFAADLAAGTYYVDVTSDAFSGPYVLQIQARAPACGNQVLEARVGEQCDDGNVTDLDGCSANCGLEPSGVVTGPAPGLSSFVGSLQPKERQIYRVVVDTPALLVATTGAPSLGICGNADTVLRLHDESLMELTMNDDFGGTTCSRIDGVIDSAARLQPGTYLLSVEGYDPAVALPAFEVGIELRPLDACGNGLIEAAEQCDDTNVDPFDGCSALCQLETGADFTGSGGTAQGAIPTGDRDYFSVTVAAGQSILAETSGANGCTGDTVLELLEPDGRTVRTSDDDSGDGPCSLIDPFDDLDARDLPAGTYFLRVRGLQAGTVVPEYRLTVSILSGFCGDGQVGGAEQCDDANRTSNDGCSATCLQESIGTFSGSGGTAAGGIAVAGGSDFYDVVVATGQYLTVVTSGPGNCSPGNTVLELHGLDGVTVLGTDDDDGPGSCSLIEPGVDLWAANLPAGTYRLRVRAAAGVTVPSYGLTVQLTASACGNGYRSGAEGCDDGNTTSNDGCAAVCRPESCVDIRDQGVNLGDGLYDIDVSGFAFEVYCDMTTDGGGFTLVEHVENGMHHDYTYAIFLSQLSSRATHAKMSDVEIRRLARAGQREAMIHRGSTRYIIRYSDAEWSSFFSTQNQNVPFDSKNSSGAWSSNVCNGHFNNRGFSTYSDAHGSVCPVRFAGPARYVTSNHVTQAYTGGTFDVYVR